MLHEPAGKILRPATGLHDRQWERWAYLPLTGSAGFVRLSTAVQPGQQDRAVHDDEAKDEDRQCRNWPEHGARIDPGALSHDPQSEVPCPVAPSECGSTRRVEQWKADARSAIS